MNSKRLSKSGPSVSALGLGCMGFSQAYGPTDDAESIATIQAALDAGITMLDTGDFYGMGHNEMLLGEALRGRRDRAFVAVKFGALRGPDGAWLGIDTHPARIKSYLAWTLKRLRTDYVDLYQPSRVDPNVPIEETIGTIADLVKAGWVRHVGVSEAGAETIRRALAVHPIVALQMEYALVTRSVEAEILPLLRERGLGLVAYGVLSRGLLGGSTGAKGRGDFRAFAPRFAPENLQKNLALVEELRTIASELGATPGELAIAWVASRGEHVIPLVGAKDRKQLASAVKALELTLPEEVLARLEAAVPAGAIAGERYPAQAMATLDSERRAGH